MSRSRYHVFNYNSDNQFQPLTWEFIMHDQNAATATAADPANQEAEHKCDGTCGHDHDGDNPKQEKDPATMTMSELFADFDENDVDADGMPNNPKHRLPAIVDTVTAAVRQTVHEKLGLDLEETCRMCQGTGQAPQLLAGVAASGCPRCKGKGKRPRPFPAVVMGIRGGECGMFGPDRGLKKGHPVSIRPCAEEFGNKTYFGFYLGEMSTVVSCRYLPPTGEIVADLDGHNPAIFVPDLGMVIFGYESWWEPINGPEDLKQITDQDIDNIWYVKALKEQWSTEQVADHLKGKDATTPEEKAAAADALSDFLAANGAEATASVVGSTPEAAPVSASSEPTQP